MSGFKIVVFFIVILQTLAWIAVKQCQCKASKNVSIIIFSGKFYIQPIETKVLKTCYDFMDVYF